MNSGRYAIRVDKYSWFSQAVRSIPRRKMKGPTSSAACFFLFTLFLPQVTPWLFGEEKVRVQIPQGELTGRAKTSDGGRTYFSFEGIPYAKQPVGELRFQMPQKAEPWEGTLDANSWVMCPQLQPIYELLKLGREDCLVVNVYTPKLPKEGGSVTPRAVMVWIHGGIYVFGSGVEYQPTFAMDHDIVMVSINFRLGPLGFMTFGDDSIPANLGLWDQVLALQWVKENIAHFGGDPEKITIFGESSGALSVFLHLMTPQHSGGLFRAAVAQSSAVGSGWALTPKNPAYYARSLAGELGCDPDGNTHDITACLRGVPAEHFVGDSARIFHHFGHYAQAFQPVLDNATSSKPFFNKDPLDTLSEGGFNHVPLIVGTNDLEGLFLRGEMERQPHLVPQMVENWHQTLATVALGRSPDEITPTDLEVLKILDKFYFESREAPSVDRQRLVLEEVYEDSYFRAVTIMNGRVFADHSKQPVYEYMYDHRASCSLHTMMTTPLWKVAPLVVARAVFGIDLFETPPGTTHGDDAVIMFPNIQVPFSPVHTEQDRKASANLWRMWTNFAKSLDPTPERDLNWERLDPSEPKFLRINGGVPAMEAESPEFRDRLDLWSQVWSKAPPTLHNGFASETWRDASSHRWRKAGEQGGGGNRQEL